VNANSRGLRPVPWAVRLTSVRAPAAGGSLSSLTVRDPAGVPVKAPNPQEAVVMGLIRKVASIMMLGGASSHTTREPPGKAERAGHPPCGPEPPA
jgi:hypothetical protein